jgi:hypothetical protein
MRARFSAIIIERGVVKSNFDRNLRIGKQISILASSNYADTWPYLEWTKTFSDSFLVRIQPIFPRARSKVFKQDLC